MTEKLFEKKHMQFMGTFAAVFILTVVLLAVLGLIPSELQENSDGYSFTQSIEHSVLSMLGVKDPADNSSASNGNAGQYNGGTNKNDSPSSLLNTNGGASGSGYYNGSNGGGSGANGANGNGTNTTTQNSTWIPSTLIISSIGVNTVIRNPMSDSISTLDYELTKGVVRYPGSGNVGSGNMFIFGHSTSFSVVQNKAYKVFNDIHTLNAGDEISVIAIDSKTSARKTFIYKVRDVTKVNKDETLIKFDTKNNMLTLSTCNSFGSKSDRYVVQADFVGVR